MERTLYKELLAWKASANRRPLILRGARQVGKTYLIKKFAKEAYDSYVYLNFEEDPNLKDLFMDSLNPIRLLEKISLYIDRPLHPLKTLIIFDEIQESPEALNCLKYFYEEAKEYHIVSAGSLLGVKLAQSKGFPVGKVNFLDLYPLSFFEFLDAIGKNKLREFLDQITELQQIPSPIHEELLSLLRKYMYIGGMPDAVSEYIKTESLLSIRKVQQAILDAYVLDFAKHAPKEQIMKITKIWEAIPSQLAKENKKFVFSAIRKSARGREYESAIHWLADAGLIYKSYNISTPKLPLSAYHDRSSFKVFLLDVGLLSAMNKIPAKIVLENNALFTEFYGAFTENYVAEALSTQDQKLYYWTSAGIAEVDFLIEHDLNIYPLEVKSGTSRNKKSLLVYRDKYKPTTLFRASLMNLKKDGNVANFPLYLISRLLELGVS